MDEKRTMTLMGPSGSGKTSLMRNIAGFDTPDSGRILIDGEDVTRMPVNKRNVGMIFQELALFPNMSVFDNIAYGLKSKRLAESEIRHVVNSLASSLRIESLLTRRPHQLSAGERQRTALARSVAVEPRLLLLDEPFSSVDSHLRIELRSELKRFASEFGLTMMFVTHDSREGFYMADDVCVIDEGLIIRKDTPFGVFNNPGSEQVATLIGYNVMLLNGKKIAFSPSKAKISEEGGIPVTIVSSGYEGEQTRVAVRTDSGQTINVYADSGTHTYDQGKSFSLVIENYVVIE